MSRFLASTPCLSIITIIFLALSLNFQIFTARSGINSTNWWFTSIAKILLFFLSWIMMSICFDSMHWHDQHEDLLLCFRAHYHLSPKRDSVDHVKICKNKVELVNSNSQGFDLWEILKVTFLRKGYSDRCFPFRK